MIPSVIQKMKKRGATGPAPTDSTGRSGSATARKSCGCHPPSVEMGTGDSFTLLPASWTIAAYLETFPAQAAFKIFKGF